MISLGLCPICADAGAVIVMARVDTGVLFFACPGCGCAWKAPPTAPNVDSINEPKELAPGGFRLASKAEVLVSKLRVADWDAGRDHTDFEGIVGFQSSSSSR